MQGWERRSSGKFTILLFFSAQASTLGVFFYLNKYASGLGSTNLCEGFFGLIFPTKRIFEPTVLLLKKAATCQPFLAVGPCLFHNHLRFKRSSLRNVYVNCKFEISLLSSYLFFSLFNSSFRKSILVTWKYYHSSQLLHNFASPDCINFMKSYYNLNVIA